MGKLQKAYTKEFKEEAVRLAQTSGKPIAQIARELGILDSAIHEWHKELAEHGQEAFSGKGHQMIALQEGLQATRRFALGAVFVYQLALFFRLQRHLDLCVGLKAFLKSI